MEYFTKPFQYYNSNIVPVSVIRFYFIILEFAFCSMSGYVFDKIFWQYIESLIAKHVGEWEIFRLLIEGSQKEETPLRNSWTMRLMQTVSQSGSRWIWYTKTWTLLSTEKLIISFLVKRSFYDHVLLLGCILLMWW